MKVASGHVVMMKDMGTGRELRPGSTTPIGRLDGKGSGGDQEAGEQKSREMEGVGLGLP